MALWAVLAGAVGAAEWGGLTPGETTQPAVERLYGQPTRTRVITEEGRTAEEWTYAGDRAPRGIERMVLGFGLIRSGRFDPRLLRSVTLYPAPRLFTVEMIVTGWGKPDATGEQTGRPAMRYDAKGLFIVLDRSGEWAETLLFAPERSSSDR